MLLRGNVVLKADGADNTRPAKFVAVNVTGMLG